MVRNARRWATAVTALAAAAASLWAGPGDLDLSFNGTGTVLTNVGNSGNARGGALLVDSQNRIVLAGCTAAPDMADYHLVVMRYNTDGTFDQTFGTGGKVESVFETPVCADGWVGSAFDALGRILVVSGTLTSDGGIDFLVARYTEDGILDGSFGNGGKVTTDFGDWDVPSGVAVDSKGRIVVAGWTTALGSSDFAVARYLSDGSLDVNFGGGKVIFAFKAPNVFDAASAVAIDGADRPIVVGMSGGQFDEAIAVARLTEDGVLDSTFGGDGKVLTTFPGSAGDAATSVLLDPAGRILVGAGTSIPGGSEGLVRYNADGTLDNLFGSGGRTWTAAAGESCCGTAGIALDASGRIVTVGQVAEPPALLRFAVFRFTPDGLVDPTFGSDGHTVTNFPGETGFGQDFPQGVAIDGLGRIVAGGFAEPEGFVFAAARYQSEAAADLSLALSGNPNPVLAGDTATYTLTVTNTGPDPAQSVVVSDFLPASVSFVSCNATSGGVCGGSGNNRTIVFNSLAAGASATITLQAAINANVPDGTSIVNSATVSSATADPNVTNNSATTITSVQNLADLFTTMSVTKLSSRQLRFTVTVKNLGPFAARQVTFGDTLPAGTTFASLAGGTWTCSAPPRGAAGTVTCASPLVASGASQVFTLVLNVTANGSSSITNTSTASSSTFDPNAANNSATIVTHLSGK